MKLIIFCLSLLGVIGSQGCGGSEPCSPGRSVQCACSNGASGAQVCLEDRTFGPCNCGEVPAVDGEPVVRPRRDGGTTPTGLKRVFVTSSTYSGKLGGLAGADSICTNAANAALLGGKWKAWMSSEETGIANAIDRIADVGPWYRLDGQKVFNNKANLVTTPLIEISIDEQGRTPDLSSGSYVWTGTSPTGAVSPYGTCYGWANGLSGYAARGRFDSTTGWGSGSDGHCDQLNHLYCFEQ